MRVSSAEDAEELAYRVPGLLWVPEVPVPVHRVAIAASFAAAGDITGRLQIIDDGGRRTLGDANSVGNISQTGTWLMAEHDEDMGMVREKSPAATIRIQCRAARINHVRMIAII